MRSSLIRITRTFQTILPSVQECVEVESEKTQRLLDMYRPPKDKTPPALLLNSEHSRLAAFLLPSNYRVQDGF